MSAPAEAGKGLPPCTNARRYSGQGRAHGRRASTVWNRQAVPGAGQRQEVAARLLGGQRQRGALADTERKILFP